jgi:hypothetical protein
MKRQDQRIESLRLVGIGPFEDCTIHFPPNAQSDLAEVHLFTGGNGSGKSTLLYGLAAMFLRPDNSQVSKTVMNRFRGMESYLDYGLFGQRFVLGRHDAPLIDNLPTLFKQQGYPRLQGTDAKWMAQLNAFHSQNWREISYAFLPLAYSGQRLQERGGRAPAIQEIQSSPLVNHLGFGQAIDPNLTTQWIANVLAKEAFALKDGNQALAQQHRTALDRVIQAIRDIAGGEFNFELDSTTLDITICWRGAVLPLDLLPDGLKSILSWLSDVLMRMDRLPWAENRPVTDQPLILFLDEIDIHLHPQWQRKILPVIQKLFPNAQVFVSTHSPFVVGSVQDAWVYKLGVDDAPLCGRQLDAIPSGAGTSYEVLLEEVFGVSEHFDLRTQNLLQQLRQERDELLRNTHHSPHRFQKIASELQAFGEELALIVSVDIRQLKKHGVEIVLESI